MCNSVGQKIFMTVSGKFGVVRVSEEEEEEEDEEEDREEEEEEKEE